MASASPPVRAGKLVNGEIIEKMVLRGLSSASNIAGGSKAATEALAKSFGSIKG